MTLAWIFHAASSDDLSPDVPVRRVHADGTDVHRERQVDPYASLSDGVRAGDEQAFDALYRQFYAPLVGFAGHYDIVRAVAEEMVQETFLAIWRTRATWTVRGTVREYLFGAVRNRVLDYRRHERVKNSAGRQVDAHVVAGIANHTALPDTLATDAELRDALTVVLDMMPAERRQVLVLRWQDDLSYPEIAAILRISVNAAKQQGSRAQRALRDLLGRFRP